MPATSDAVLNEWLDPEALMHWMCPAPAGFVATTVEQRVGGIVRLDVDDSGTCVLTTGQFLTIDRPRLLRFTWTNSN